MPRSAHPKILVRHQMSVMRRSALLVHACVEVSGSVGGSVLAADHAPVPVRAAALAVALGSS